MTSRFIATLAMVLAMVFTCTTALAQDSVTAPLGGLEAPVADGTIAPPEATPEPAVAPAEGGSDFTPILTTIKDSLTAVLIALLTAAMAWLSAQLARWTGGKIALDDVLRDLNMESYARQAAEKAFEYALRRTNHTWADLQHVEIKSQVLSYATNFLLSQYPEVTKWIDKDQNGIIDWVETLLPVASRANVNTASMGLMAAPAKRAAKPKPKPKVAKSLDIPAFKEPLAA